MGESEGTNIQFFGEIDRKRNEKTGDILHTFPAWYATNKLDELSDEISDLKTRIRTAEEGGFMYDKVPMMKRELNAKEDQFSRIAASKPNLSGKEKDAVAKMYQELGERIRGSMPTRTDMERGTTSAHEEAKRMKLPCIDVPHGTAMLMQKMGINASRGGKISRDDAARAWKICGRLLDAHTNTEVLRRDIAGGSYKIHRSIEEMEKD